MARHILACFVLTASVISIYNQGAVDAGVAVRRSFVSFSVDLDKTPTCKGDSCKDDPSNNNTMCSSCVQLTAGNQTLERVTRDADENGYDVFRMWMGPARRLSAVAISRNGDLKVTTSPMKGKKKLRSPKGRKGKRSKKAKRAGAENGMAVAAVGDGDAVSSDGKSYLHANGKKKPSVATSGNGAAYASDGHTSVSSKHGKNRKSGKSPAHRASEEIIAANADLLSSLKKHNQDMVANIMSKSHPRGTAASAGPSNDRDDAANFNPFKFVGMKDPREMLG